MFIRHIRAQPKFLIGKHNWAIFRACRFTARRSLEGIQWPGYVINITRGSRARHTEAFAADGFDLVPGRDERSPVEVKTIPDPDDADGSLVLCRSALRREKETAMLSSAESRFPADIDALRKRIADGRLKNSAKIERAIGRLQKKHPRANHFYELCNVNGTLETIRDEGHHAKASELFGDYVLKTGRTRKASRPDPEQARLYDNLHIQWKNAFLPLKFFAKLLRLCSAFEMPPLLLCPFPPHRKKLGESWAEIKASEMEEDIPGWHARLDVAAG